MKIQVYNNKSKNSVNIDMFELVSKYINDFNFPQKLVLENKNMILKNYTTKNTKLSNATSKIQSKIEKYNNELINIKQQINELSSNIINSSIITEDTFNNTIKQQQRHIL